MDLGISLFDFLNEAELQHYYDQIKSELKILKTSQLKYVTDEDLSLLGMSRPEQRRLKKFYTKYYPQNYLSRIKRLLGPGKKDENCSALGSLSEERVQELQSEMHSDNVTRAPNKHIIPAENITINKELGVGEFGVVQQGVWTNDGHRIQVAIKCLCRERMHTNSMEFLKEAAIMHSIEHRSIVRLYGVVLHPDSLMLVTELAPLRSLLECLKEISLRSSFPVLTLCEFAFQICEGMTYLENKRLIHRDLAARNILVFTKNKVKISDFGLSRALGVGKDYYQTNFNVNLKLPIAWCAPECISYLRFTSASDVWAYAVTLWEMFSYGFQPWAAFSGHQILVAIDVPNFQRLEQPECCPREYFALMQKCWHHEPNKRPKFAEILHLLPDCKPEQVQAVSSSELDPNTKRADQLCYRGGEIITVLDKGGNPAATQWKGILNNGTTGLFNPQNVVSYLGSSLPSSGNQNVFARSSGEGAGSSIRHSLIRDRERSASKRRLRSDMISAPQGEVKHTGHVGLDGAYFGDVSFLEYNHLPRQVVTPYKPSEDLEQTPLINPNSPSHLTGNNPPLSPLAHPILLRETDPSLHGRGATPETSRLQRDEDDGNKYGSSVQSNQQRNLNFDPQSHQNNLPKVKWPGSKNPIEGNYSSKSRSIDASHTNECDIDPEAETQPHEYQEISDDDNQKPSDFGQSLLEEMESMFRSLGGHGKATSSAHQDHEGTNHRNELTELSSRLTNTATLSKKKQTTVKPISANDQRMLDSAIAFANELTAKSMTDLDHNEPPKTPTTPSERSKFHFRFPGGGHSHASNTLKSSDTKTSDNYGNKMDKRTFSQEAQSVPDIQSSLTEESKMAYESLVEQPARLVNTLINIRQKQGTKTPAAQSLTAQPVQVGDPPDLSELKKKSPSKEEILDSVNEQDSSTVTTKSGFSSAEPENLNVWIHSSKTEDCSENTVQGNVNPLPLPPRDRSVITQNSRKRHTRKYPLIIQDSNLQRTLNRLNHQPMSEQCVITSFEKNNPSNSNVKDNVTLVDPRLRISNTDNIVSHNFNKPYENSKIGQYQNVFTKFPFTNEDSFDTPSLKFEAQIENNFASVDCCDGAAPHDDFEFDNTLTKNTNCSQDGNENNIKECIHSENNVVTKTEEYLLNFDSIANLDLEYIDGANGSLNPFVTQINEACNKVTNPFSNQILSKKNSKFSSQPSELARNALFNKIKTDLQYLDTLTPKIPTEESNDDVATVKEKGNSEDQTDHNPAVTRAKAVDDQALPSATKQSDIDWSMQRRSIGDNIDELELCMFAKGSPDRVSVEDLLEFADHKPRGRQRGAESDEVRIMCKVLNHQVSPETCLMTLELAGWNVHRAIKLVRLRSAGPDGPSLYECSAALDECGWDVTRAAALLAAHRDSTDIAQV